MGNIGNRIKKLRNEHGLTQTDLAKILGVTKPAVQKYENGGINNLKRETIQKLCELFRVPPIFFIYENLADLPVENDFPRLYGKELFDMANTLNSLNDVGQQKVVEYTKDIYKIGEYKK